MSVSVNGLHDKLKSKEKKVLDASITVRLDGVAKKEFEKVCDKMGITVSSAINAFVEKVINLKALPFSINGYKRKRKLFVAEGKFDISDDILLNDDISELFEGEEENEYFS